MLKTLTSTYTLFCAQAADLYPPIPISIPTNHVFNINEEKNTDPLNTIINTNKPTS